VTGQNEINSEGVVAGRQRKGRNSFRVDELVGTVSQGSPESIRGNRWADGFESRWDSKLQTKRLSPSVLATWYYASVSEFQEIASSGGKIELLYQEGDGVALQFTHANPYACGAIQMGVSLDGTRLEYWPIYGVDQRPPQPESPMVAAFVISDREGYFGRACPKCKSYFRTSSPGKVTCCPYCGVRAVNAAFTTKNQLEFINKVRESYIAAFEKKQS